MVVPTGLAPSLSALIRTGLRTVSNTGPVRLPSETCAEEDACLLPPNSGGGKLFSNLSRESLTTFLLLAGGTEMSALPKRGEANF